MAVDANRELSAEERVSIAVQLAAGRDQVHLWLMAEPGHATDVAAKLTALGGEVSLLETDVDFLHARVPIARVPEVMQWPELTAAEVEKVPEAIGRVFYTSPQTQTGATSGEPAPRAKPGVPPSASTPRNNPYTGESATQALQFKTAHPQYDGRGVVIGGIEPVNPYIPSLSRAMSLGGERVPKFADYLLLPPFGTNVARAVTNVNSTQHGTMCASVAVGHDYLDGAAEGVAPGAQFLPVQYSSANEGPLMQMRAWLALYRDARVDVLTNSTDSPNNRGWIAPDRQLYAQFFQRLLAKYPKLQLKAAGNSGPEESGYPVHFEGSPAHISIGAYTPAETWQANFGFTPVRPHTLPYYSSYGPLYDGSLNPDLLALAGTLCAVPGKEAGRLESPYYETPPGYGVSAGTSAAAPNAAGLAALLVSAAKQAGVPYDPARLKVALFSSAKFLPGIPVRAQGHGLIQVADAWQALQKLKDHPPLTFTTQAPVRTFHSERLTSAHMGRGLYERVGWSANRSGERDVTITRTSGPEGPVTYRLRWREAVPEGSKPAFSSKFTQIALPLNRPVRLPIRIRVGASGAYSALVDLIDPATGLIAHSVPCTVVAAESLNAGNDYTVAFTRSVPRMGNEILYVNVPPGAVALRIQMTQKNGKAVALHALTPEGQSPIIGMTRAPNGNIAALRWRPQPSDQAIYNQTFAHPLPGVWQLRILYAAPDTYDPAEPQPPPPAEVVLHATADFVTASATIENVRQMPPAPGTLRTERPVLNAGVAPKFYDIEVAQGIAQLKVQAQLPSAAADLRGVNLSLVIFFMEEKENSVNTLIVDIRPGSRKLIELDDPKPGRYKICLDAWGEIPDMGIEVSYSHALYHQ